MNRLRQVSTVVLLSLLFAVFARAQVTFTTIDFPGAAGTEVLGINTAGDVVGAYYLTPYLWHGFKYSAGQFTPIDYPGAQETLAFGINDSGMIVGWYDTGQGLSTYGFQYDGKTFTPLQYGNQVITEAKGINNAGQIVGLTGNSNAQLGLQVTGGRLTIIEPPGKSNYFYAAANGINNLGDVVGDMLLYTSNFEGFRYTNGNFEKLDYPGATSTYLYGINDSGIMVGYYAYSNAA